MAGAAAAKYPLGDPHGGLRAGRGAATGAAAGLSAAFNTPLAAVTFVLEEIIGDLNSRLLGGVLLAAMIGALTVHALLGPQPAFSIAPLGEPTWRAYVFVPFVAVAAALVGAAFQDLSLRLRGLCKKRSPIPRWVLPGLGALVCWAIGAAVFLRTGRLAVFGLGYDDLSDALSGRMAWQLAGLLLLTKFIATVSCYGTGGCGGIFSPTLFFGAMTGLVVGGIGNLALPLQPGGAVLLAIVGMSATLGAVVRAPVTGILLRTEAASAVREKRVPSLEEAITCGPDERVRTASGRLVATSVGMIVIQESAAEPVRALFTLHDLLRAQIAAAEHHDAMGD